MVDEDGPALNFSFISFSPFSLSLSSPRFQFLSKEHKPKKKSEEQEKVSFVVSYQNKSYILLNLSYCDVGIVHLGYSASHKYHTLGL